ncbi:MAG: asparagine synthase (glutamine-hydrolyzing) [Phycisphaerales bacterium]
MLDEGIKHRGPDGQGRFRDRAIRPDGSVVDVAFVHRRLSILDHEGGHQPMVHDGERLRPDLTYQPGEEPKLAHELCPDKPLVAVVFNGCIYNQHELRTELTQQGAWFETDHSDTEVLVHGWRRWGLLTQDRVDGMYALLAWDRTTGQLAAARDLAGEKPLFSARAPRDRIVLYASSAPPIERWTAQDDSENTQPIRFLLAWVPFGFHYLNPTSTRKTFEGVWRLHGDGPSKGAESRGSRSPDDQRDRRWSRPVRGGLGYAFSHHVAVQEMLERSVSERLEADVPLGVFLSGGIDSGLLAAIAKKHIDELHTFTLRMPDPGIDESEAAAETARTLGTNHTALDCEANPADDLVGLVQRLGLPLGDSSLLPTYWLCRAAREHVRVALSGDGGDELFGGYRRHQIAPMLKRHRKILRCIPAHLIGQRASKGKNAYLARLLNAARHCGYDELLAIFQTPDLRRLLGRDAVLNLHYPGSIGGSDPLTRDFAYYLPDDLLRKTDTASMSVALEVRAPFLARELVEAALRTPLEVLMPNNERKGLLKRVARKYLPDHIVDRPKQGFAIPIGQWFRDDYGGLRQLLYDHLESADPFPGLAGAGVDINMGFVRQMLREHDAAGEKSINPWHGRDHSQRLYMLLVLSIWARWLDGLRPVEPSDES